MGTKIKPMPVAPAPVASSSARFLAHHYHSSHLPSPCHIIHYPSLVVFVLKKELAFRHSMSSLELARMKKVKIKSNQGEIDSIVLQMQFVNVYRHRHRNENFRNNAADGFCRARQSLGLPFFQILTE
jgi:hypothetical protein